MSKIVNNQTFQPILNGGRIEKRIALKSDNLFNASR